MRCKPGELVRYIGSNISSAPNCYGWIGKTISPVDLGEGIEWLVEPPINTIGGGVPWDHVFDRSLQPIRPEETPEQSIEAMNLLHQLPKETV